MRRVLSEFLVSFVGSKNLFFDFLDIFCYALISSLLLYSLLKECRACAFFEIILNCNPHVIECGSLASIWLKEEKQIEIFL